MKSLWRIRKSALCALLAVGLMIPAMPVVAIAAEHVPAIHQGISGTVMTTVVDNGETTATVPNAAVTVWTAAHPHTVVATTTADMDGYYEVEVDAGDYYVQFEAEGFADQFYNEQPDLASADIVTVHESEVTLIEIWGPTRFGTAIEVAREAYPAGNDTVILARGDIFADALAGASLAGLLDAPILLTRSESLLLDVADEIQLMGATRVILLGETEALSAQVAASALAVDSVEEVIRYGGPTRYETASIICEEVIDQLGPAYDGEVFIARGDVFVDALVASPVSAAQGIPLLLAHPSQGLRTTTLAALDNADEAIVLGGTTAVSASIEAQLRTLLNDNVSRLQGVNRYQTAVRVAEYGVSVGHTWDMVGIANGDYPDTNNAGADALTGGPYQGKIGSVMLLTRTNTLPSYTAAAIQTHAAHINAVHIYGGPVVITPAVRAAIMALLPGMQAVTEGINAMLIGMVAPPAEPAQGFSGAVMTMDNGAPVGVVGAEVHVYAAGDTSTPVATTVVTEADGTFQVPIGAVGEYYIHFMADGYVGQWYDGAMDFEDAITVTKVADEFVVLETVMLTAPIIQGVSGTLVEHGSGMPIAGAKVDVYDAADSGAPVATATTAADGTYIVAVDPGSYKVHFSADGYTSKWYDNKGAFPAADVVGVLADTITTGISQELVASGP